MREQRRKQTAEDHRVGDVRDVELVEADEAMALCDPGRDKRKRILFVLECCKLLVHGAHEHVEMDACLAADGHRRKEAVHQEALAAPDATPHVHAARNVRRQEDFCQRRLARGAERFELRGKDFQPVERRELRMIECRATGREQRLEPVDKGVVTRRDVAFDATSAHECRPIRD